MCALNFCTQTAEILQNSGHALRARIEGAFKGAFTIRNKIFANKKNLGELFRIAKVKLVPGIINFGLLKLNGSLSGLIFDC